MLLVLLVVLEVALAISPQGEVEQLIKALMVVVDTSEETGMAVAVVELVLLDKLVKLPKVEMVEMVLLHL
jgi:hypothetical protein